MEKTRVERPHRDATAAPSGTVQTPLSK